MVFTSTVFLFAFLPVAVLTFYLFPAGMRALPLLVLSAVFYGWGEPVLVLLILASTVVNYFWGRVLRTPGLRGPKVWLGVGIALNLAPLAVFKYLGFTLRSLGLDELAADVVLPLPIGVSFYTFMAISYLVDIYRRRNEGAPSWLHFGAYLTMFPHLVAGPIVRWGHVGPQLLRPRFDAGLFGYGGLRVAAGLLKKSVLADSLSPVVDGLFAGGAPSSVGAAWVAAGLYALQIYLDFSAYSDIAIGLAAMLGVRFEENFRYPYLSRSAREFWQRWHMTLGSWFRDYVYIPMGGSRATRPVVWRNLMVVWGLTGLWHGAAWTFVLWGLYYGVLIGLERFWFGDALERLPAALQHGYGLLVAVLGWVLFRSSSVEQAASYYRSMFGLGGVPGWDGEAAYAVAQTSVLVVVAVVLAAGAARPLTGFAERALVGTDLASRGVTVSLPWERNAQAAPDVTPEAGATRTRSRLTAVSVGVVVAGMLVVATAYVVSVTYQPFIYFRF